MDPTDSSPINPLTQIQRRYNATPVQTPTRPARAALTIQPAPIDSPGNPLAPIKHRKQLRNGYEQSPKTPSYRPYSLNNPGTPRQKAFNISNPAGLQSIPALDPEQWNNLAVKSGVIAADAQLRGFQIQISNLVLMRRGDALLISPTGSGKSLTWILPLLARKEGMSLVVTPYTSLGLDGELSNKGDGISSLFVYSEQNSQQDFEKAATGEMLVIYVCPEMLKSPSFACLIHSASWRGRLSAIYIDEAHLVHQTHTWRPSYSRIYQFRKIVGLDTPLIALSATCPELYRHSLLTFAGLRMDYTLINHGNFRPELSTIILPMLYDITSFLDIAFILPLGTREADLVPTIVYADDLELLTKMFWWAFSRAASMGIPTHAIDIIHSGLSVRHQELCMNDFRNGITKILLGSSKISAGINFPGVKRVVQYKCRDLRLPNFDQRRGRGARRQGETAVGMIFVEPSMKLGGDFSVENPGEQDPGMIELVQSDECAEAIIQRHLDNPRHNRDPSYNCCNRCDPSMQPGREYEWVEENPGPSSAFPTTNKSTTAQRELIYDKLAAWCLQHWRSYRKAKWPSYGPKTLISDSDLEELAAHTNKINCIEDMRRYTHIVHWKDLSTPLFESLQGICQELNLLPPAPEIVIAEPTVNQPPQKRRKTTEKRKPEELAQGEMIIDFQ
ncbi:ATP-dependent DNA helicase [Mycena pura]|uniref:DNA 3'-5' helicase n=1 Tax=Mycena pura TaxID=153505 RepID=A0AAD6VLB4_9AGAR|nr:ATP-dependent DNA helicase [Mycena pura]